MAYTDIDKSDEYFNTKLYTGNGGTQSVTGVGFQPDFTWIKERNNAHDASIMDVVRGVRKSLTPSNTEVEYTETTGLSSWDSDGFSFDGAGFDHVNTSGDSFVAWNWLASNTTASNTDGSITSTVSANTTSGFSIVSFTGNATGGATIGHGLGSAPSLILTKNRDFAYNWHLWTHAFSSYNDTIQLNTTAAIDTGTLLNNTAPTSSLITLGSSAVINASGEKIIAYVFAEKKGFSKFGKYTGNGNANGTFVYTGFTPAFVMIKRTDTTSNWDMYDNKRNDDKPAGANYIDRLLYANANDAEVDTGGAYFLDFLSNGFKLRGTGADINASGGTYIYMAFAENPFVSSTSIPTTAR